MKKTMIATAALAAVTLAGAQTVRNLVIVDNEGNQAEIRADKIMGITFEEAPEYVQLTTLLAATYEEQGPLGIYDVEFGTGDPDINGDPENVGDFQIGLVMAGPWSDEVKNPKLPVGTYTIGNSTEEMTFDVSKSAIWERLEPGDDGVTALMIIGGTVEVSKVDESGYRIVMDLTDMAGVVHNFIYEGPVDFAGGWSQVQPFTEPVDVNFTVGQGRFYSNWYYPFASDITLQFYEGKIENGYFMNGYALEISMFEPKVEDDMNPVQKIADGTYVVDKREEIAYEYLPFRFLAGERVDFLGQELVTKTRLEYYGEDGSRRLGLITGGSFTVSENGSKFLFDFTTAEGVSVKGTYDKAPNVTNYCDNDVKAPKRPYSLLDSDVTLNFIPGTICLTYNEGHRILDDANIMTVWFIHPSQAMGDYLWLDLFVEGDELTDGTYTVSSDLGVGKIIKGDVDYAGAMKYSWYADLAEVDDEGYNTCMAPIGGGTVTVSTQADGQRKFVFNLVDDDNHTITGEFTCNLIDGNAVDTDMPAKVRKNSKRALRTRASR